MGSIQAAFLHLPGATLCQKVDHQFVQCNSQAATHTGPTRIAYRGCQLVSMEVSSEQAAKCNCFYSDPIGLQGLPGRVSTHLGKENLNAADKGVTGKNSWENRVRRRAKRGIKHHIDQYFLALILMVTVLAIISRLLWILSAGSGA